MAFHRCPASLMCALEALASLALLAPQVCESATLLMTIPHESSDDGTCMYRRPYSFCFCVNCFSLFERFGFQMLHLPKCTCATDRQSFAPVALEVGFGHVAFL